MAAPNQTHYQSRLDFIQQNILCQHLGLGDDASGRASVTPIHYDPNCPFAYNNFVYHIKIADSSPAPPPSQQPGCVPIPSGTSDFILRLSNQDAEGMHRATRVENEVAIMSMASAALRHIKPHVVPRVFAWGSAADSQGWILQERMSGIPGDEALDKMDPSQKKEVVAQMAALLKGLQDYRLPDTVQGWGGVTFDSTGNIVSGPMVTTGTGPWSSFHESYRARFQAALASADGSPHIQGWRADGVRERIEAFLENGMPALFSTLTSKNEKAIVHADFNANNLLVDPSSARITALLDYDFSSILHPCQEFLRSFSVECGQLQGWTADMDDDGAALRKAKLTGTFPSPLPANSELIQWDLAKAWEDELERLQAKRPSTIAGMENVADLDALLDAILPWQLSSQDFLHGKGETEVDQMRRYFGGQLIALMEHMGL